MNFNFFKVGKKKAPSFGGGEKFFGIFSPNRGENEFVWLFDPNLFFPSFVLPLCEVFTHPPPMKTEGGGSIEPSSVPVNLK